MTFLPVVSRELRVASRRRATYWARFTAAFVVLMLAGFILFEQQYMNGTQLSKSLFFSISTFAFIFCLSAGGGLTSDSISEEKREGTLGLLFLTDLKGYDVVLGKLVATSVNSVYRLLAILPVMAIPLLLGGLAAAEFWRMTLVLLNALLFSLSAGMFASAISRYQRKAISVAALLVFAVNAGPLVAEALYSYRRTFEPRLLLPSLGYAFYLSPDLTYRPDPGQFWISSAITFGISISFLALASFIVPRSWKDRPAGAGLNRWQDRWFQWTYGSRATRQVFRTRLLDQNPYFWLAARNRLKPFYVLALLGLLGAVWGSLAWKFGRDFADVSVLVLTCIAIHAILKVWVSSESAATLAEERRAGSLELLLSTPLEISDILRGQILAARRQFGIPVLLALGLDIAVYFAGRNDWGASDAKEWLLLCLVGITVFVGDLFTLIWVSMWLGLISRKPNLATRGATARILILPWSVFVLVLVLIGFADRPRFPTPTFFILLWFVISVVVDVGFFFWAWTNLHHQFRESSARRFESETAGWLSLFGLGRRQQPNTRLEQSSVRAQA